MPFIPRNKLFTDEGNEKIKLLTRIYLSLVYFPLSKFSFECVFGVVLVIWLEQRMQHHQETPFVEILHVPTPIDLKL